MAALLKQFDVHETMSDEWVADMPKIKFQLHKGYMPSTGKYSVPSLLVERGRAIRRDDAKVDVAVERDETLILILTLTLTLRWMKQSRGMRL